MLRKNAYKLSYNNVGNPGCLSDHIVRTTSNDGVAPILDFSLKTQSDSLQALPILQNKVEQLALHRGQIGAFESRTNFALSLTEMKALNSETAASRIMDVDVAEETSKLVTNQIIQQSAVFTLAQANLQPQLVLALLSED